MNRSDKQELLERLNELIKKQSLFQHEINELQLQITQLKTDEPKSEPVKHLKEVMREPVKPKTGEIQKIVQRRKTTKQKPGFWKQTEINSEIEQFIGTNLINKIGMFVVIIGVGIGVKYAIDNNLISPAMRIVLGYLTGGVLTYLALRLKKKYFNFSAVLFSGAMAIYYFITYAAYTYYSFYPHSLTFILMVLFTVLTVFLALNYNQQVIAHYGLVGAYLVPFLLKDPDSSVLVLFTYMVIVNAGILFISTKKQWKPLNYVAFVATWVIFLSWFARENYNNQLGTALIFASLFFTIFYLVFLSYKLILKEKFKIDDIFYLLLNAAVFYVVGIYALSNSNTQYSYEALFTFINAIIHGLTAVLIYRSKTENKNLFLWTIGMVVAFITIAIGIQYNDYITAILWSAEAAFLFWLGRNKKIIVFDYLSFVLICITFGLVVSNWFSISYNFQPATIKKIYTPVFSLEFLSSLLVMGSFLFIHYTNKRFVLANEKLKNWLETFNILFPVFFLITIFFTFYNEIDLFWNNIQIYASYKLNNEGIWVKAYEQLNNDIINFKIIWLINYSLLFTSLLAFANFKWIKGNILNTSVFGFSGLLIFIFLVGGLRVLGVLRDSYMNANLPANYDVNIFHLLIRYVAYMFFALLFYSVYRFVLPLFTNKQLLKVFEIVLSVSIIWICSSELIHWLNLSGSKEVYKHGLSILWGVFSFILIGYGIWKKKKHLRITSIVLFGGTIIKLFVYDLSNLTTVPKTIVFISIGALLLVVSFMYNKYSSIIFGNDLINNHEKESFN